MLLYTEYLKINQLFIQDLIVLNVNQKFHFIINIAIGGNWGGMKGIDDTAFPAKMEIEHFRVYKKNT